jgi:hypothetical protein
MRAAFTPPVVFFEGVQITFGWPTNDSRSP